MTDAEIGRKCAVAMGIDVRESPLRGTVMRWWYWDENVERMYDPLHDDAQAMALVKKFELRLQEPEPEGIGRDRRWRVMAWIPKQSVAQNQDLNRAICECVAKLPAATD